MKLEQIVPFGRSLDEYRGMFLLSRDDLSKSILGIGDGPASFNAEMTRLGYRVLSVDPLYVFTGPEIEQQFYAVLDDIIEQVKRTPEDWVWTHHQSPEDLRDHRIAALRMFLADFEKGKHQQRYMIGELPRLHQFHDKAFDLALCSHFLFLYSGQLDEEFHKAAIKELVRVAKEIRIFPLLTLQGKRSAHVEPVMQSLQDQGYDVAAQTVPYELQRGGNEMLWVKDVVV